MWRSIDPEAESIVAIWKLNTTARLNPADPKPIQAKQVTVPIFFCAHFRKVLKRLNVVLLTPIHYSPPKQI